MCYIICHFTELYTKQVYANIVMLRRVKCHFLSALNYLFQHGHVVCVTECLNI
jgi:hypothetical protein